MTSADRLPVRMVTTVHWTAASVVRPLHALMSAPVILFLATMTIVLLRAPDVAFYGLDRAALFLLLFVVGLRALLMHQPLFFVGPVTWPMLGLMTLAFMGLITQPYDQLNWSVFVAKWLTPFVLYQAAALVFQDAASLRKFEVFAWAVLGYLIFIAVMSLIGAPSLIFPSFILNDALGTHTDRARGPFLQAVANGVALNLLGILALDSFRRGRLPRLLTVALLGGLPVAILATKTRAVWLAFAASLMALTLVSPSRRMRRACLVMLLAGGVSVGAVIVIVDGHSSFTSRLEESGPVEFRVALYQAGWEMFQQRPLLGWTANDAQGELARRISDFHQEAFYFHNSYLEVAVMNGAVGLLLYLWVVIDLFRVGRPRGGLPENDGFLDARFRAVWPVLVLVYVVNANFVVMNYQFVNGLLFSVAGMMAGQDRRLPEMAGAM